MVQKLGDPVGVKGILKSWYKFIWANRPANQLNHKVNSFGFIVNFSIATLTSTLGPGDEWWSWLPRATFPRAGEQDPNLIFGVRVQMPQLVRWCIDSMGLSPSPRCHPVLHFFQDNGAIPNDGVGIQLDEQVRGPNAQQLRGCYRPRWLCRGDKK